MVFLLKVGSTIEEVSTAAEQYLGKETEELKVGERSFRRSFTCDFIFYDSRRCV